MNFKPYGYQKKAIDFIVKNPKCGLFLDMGLGKTVSTLLAIDELMFNRFEVTKVLVIAPLRVASATWPSEIEKWNQTKHFKYSVVCGERNKRIAALNAKADIYIVNRENVVWLIDNCDWDFDMLVIDELSSFKSTQAKRFRALKRVIKRCKRVVGLTGTPQPNGLIDLWPQMFLIDQGQRLGKTVTSFRNKYFRPGRSNGYVVYEYIPLASAEKEIYDKLSDICMSMKKEDYLDLPEKVFHDVEVNLEGKEKQLYKELKKEALLELEGKEIVALNAAAVSNKLQQLANGAVYDENHTAVTVHDKKLDALEELIEQANGSPILVFYSFQHDKQRIQARIPDAREIVTTSDINDWNGKKIPVAICHPASVGHGLNLQKGGHIIVWFSLTWSLELYLQANDRLHRNGQTEAVQIYHLIAKGTIDEQIMQVLKEKNTKQEALMAYLKSEVEKI